MPERTRRGVGRAVLLLAAMIPALAAAQGGGRRPAVQCWTDDRGTRVCGDVVPPSEVRRERALIDPRGRVTGVVPAQKSAAEYAAERERAEADAQRAAYDRFLLQTYADVGAIERVRDDRLATLDARLRLTGKAMADTRATLDDLHARQQKHAAPGAAPLRPAMAAALQARIDEFSRAEADHAKALARLEDERARISGEFDRDIARYRALRTGASH